MSRKSINSYIHPSHHLCVDKKIFILITVTSLIFSQEENIEEVISVGTKASLKSAIDKQRESDQIVSIVDSDALGEFPDETAAEAVRRLPGVNVENDQGEGRYITLRGMSGDLNAVSMNGALIPAPEGGRKVLLDGLPTDLIDSIEVYKSLVPSQDSEGIGGRVEFKTKRATELDDVLFKLKFDNLYNDFVDAFDSPKYSLTYGQKYNDNFGLVLGYTYQDKHIISNNNETGYEPWGIADNSYQYLSRDWEMRFYDLSRQREGFTIDLDFALDDQTNFFLNYLTNEYTDDELRHKDEYRARSLVESSVTPTSASYQRITSDKETRKRIEVRQIETKVLGFESIEGDITYQFQVSESFAEEDDSNNVDAKFRAECRVRDGDDICGTYSWVNPKFISLSLAPRGQVLNDINEYEWDEFEIDYGVIQDSEVAYKLDMQNDNLSFYGKPMVLEFGLKSSKRVKSNSEGNYDAAGDVPEGLVNYSPYTPGNWYFPVPLSFFADPSIVFGYQSDVRPNVSIDLADYWKSYEDINAAYIMATVNYDNAVVVVGVRNERTDFSTQGYNDGNSSELIQFSRSYNFFAPSVNMKYFLSDEVQLRAAFFRSLSRPGFKETAPIPDINEGVDGDYSGSMGNPSLNPYMANNFDLGIEMYREQYFLTFGIFYKDIQNTIYPRVIANQNIGELFFSDLETFANAGDSNIIGLEINFFAELDPYLSIDGFFVSANGTFSDGESDFNTGNQSFTIPFRKLSEQNANLSLGYDQGKIESRLAVNYRSSYLDYLGDEGEEMFDDNFGYGYIRFTDDYYSVDLTARYKYNNNLSFKFEGKNLGNQPEFYYWNTSNRLSQYDEYGYSLSFGVRFNY